jgi:hypothetical protein
MNLFALVLAPSPAGPCSAIPASVLYCWFICPNHVECPAAADQAALINGADRILRDVGHKGSTDFRL